MSDLSERLSYLVERLRTVYDGIGHSTGRPYVYFVYPPDHERAMRRLADEYLRSDTTLTFHHVDLLPLTVQSLAGKEQHAEQSLSDARRRAGMAESIMRIWARAASQAIAATLEREAGSGRPVAVLRGLAALHPIGTPTGLMEALAEQELRDPTSGRIVPVVVLVPGTRPPQTSRTYRFLGLEQLQLQFYRGEEA